MNDALLESPLIEFHRAAGCEVVPYFGVTLPAQFSDPLSEHRTARQAVALIDTNFRSVFSLSGPDRVRYLNAVLTSNVRDLAPGQGTVGLLLNAQGHILAELETLACEDRILTLGHMQVRDKTEEILEKFIIMDDVTLTDETAEYGTVSTGTTGHAESIQITFDPALVSYADILQIFFSVAHDPTELNRQGPDTGTQYRSEIFFADETQQKTALAYIAQLDQSHVFGHRIVTRVDPLKGFYPAEGYHQDFLVRNPRYPYIVYNDLPKIANLKRELPQFYVDQPTLVAAAK